jgi:hypothetical protein
MVYITNMNLCRSSTTKKALKKISFARDCPTQLLLRLFGTSYTRAAFNTVDGLRDRGVTSVGQEATKTRRCKKGPAGGVFFSLA